MAQDQSKDQSKDRSSARSQRLDPQKIARFVQHVSPRQGEALSYAVLDSARGYAVNQAIRWSGRPYRTLYRGHLPPELEQAAPYVVELGDDHSFTRRVLAEGWGDNWGFFVVANASFPELHQHLRSLLRVKTEDGRVLVFRYYDPRVLRVYLPTCTPDELRTFFGPIGRIIAEDDGGGALAFERRQGELLVSPLPL